MSWFGTVGRHRNCKRFQTTRCNSAKQLHLKAAICSSRHKISSRLALYQKNNERGLSELLLLKCSCCEAETPQSTSRQLGGKGGGPVSTDVCQKHLIKIKNATKKHAEEVMNGAAERLQNKVLKEQPDQIEDGEDIIRCVSVTVDGTWQKRGHSSKMVGGKRFTDKVIDKMQNYYRKAIRSNKGDLNRMKESIKAIQYHMIKNLKLALKNNTNIAQRLATPGANTGRIRMRKQNCIMRTITFQKYLWQSWIPFFKGYLKMIYSTDV